MILFPYLWITVRKQLLDGFTNLVESNYNLQLARLTGWLKRIKRLLYLRCILRIMFPWSWVSCNKSIIACSTSVQLLGNYFMLFVPSGTIQLGWQASKCWKVHVVLEEVREGSIYEKCLLTRKTQLKWYNY